MEETPVNTEDNPKSRLRHHFSRKPIRILLVLILVGLTGGGVWMWQQDKLDTAQGNVEGLKAQLLAVSSSLGQPEKNTTDPEPQAQAPEEKQIADFSIQYPAGWRTQALPKSQGSPTVDITSTAPNGVTLKVNANLGGRGGDCIPEPSDKPHAAGNHCPTMEYLSKEPINQTVHEGHSEAGKKVPLLLVKARYTETDGISKYIIGLEDVPFDFIKLNQPTMGYQLSFTTFGITDKKGTSYQVDIYASGDSANFFNTNEAKQIIEALKTFKFD